MCTFVLTVWISVVNCKIQLRQQTFLLIPPEISVCQMVVCVKSDSFRKSAKIKHTKYQQIS